MSVILIVRNKVKDFDTWKKVFDSGAEFTKQNGVIASKVMRDLDDPNVVIVYQEFAETSHARAFMGLFKTDEFREGPVKVGGVIEETMEVWIGADVS